MAAGTPAQAEVAGHLVAPAATGELSGGHIYNQRMLDALAARGFALAHHALAGDWPEPDAGARACAAECLAALPDGAVVVIDGLALGGMPDLAVRESARLCLVGLVHLPLATEFGVDAHRLAQRGAAETRALAACHRLIATSAHSRTALIARGFPGERIDVVVPGTDPAPLAAGSGSGRVLIAVGALIPRKGQDVLVEALARIADTPWSCRLVGSGERDPAFVAALRATIQARGLSERITFCGQQAGSDLEAVWASADIAVLASRYEGFGMVLSEAVARGLPVVATAGGAVSEAVPAGAGLLALPGDAAALAACLDEVLTDEATRAGLARRAREARADLPDWPAQAARFERALRVAAA